MKYLLDTDTLIFWLKGSHMIASITLSNDLILVTNNIKHFDRIEKLKIENWLTN